MWAEIIFYNFFSLQTVKSFQYKRFIQSALYSVRVAGNQFGQTLSGAGASLLGAGVGIQIGVGGGGDTACKSCLRLYVMKNQVLTLNHFCYINSVLASGSYFFRRKKNITLFLCLNCV